MIQPLLENVVFRSNNSEHQPILNALSLIKKYFDSNKVYFPDTEDVPMGCLPEKWEGTNLIDMIKEVDLENQFTRDFISYGQKIYLKPHEISERILLTIYGMGTNVGLKHMCAGNAHASEHQRRHIKNYFLSTDNLKNALSKVANALFKIRLEEIWGGMPIAVASDSTQFSAYFQNLISEYHNRYGGRGVMIYWHVEKNACCIHSQLKSVSSSEVSAMIEGVLRHCTEMSVQKNYVDTHGQSEVGFAFSHLLMHESIRQEIQEGLNVVELWNGVSKFIFYGRAGEISSNHEKTKTLSVLSLHLLQLSMVYINTLMIQQIIEEHSLKDILTKEDKRALTPLIYEHVNPYGLFPLDLSTRLPHLHYKAAA